MVLYKKPNHAGRKHIDREKGTLRIQRIEADRKWRKFHHSDFKADVISEMA